MAIGASHWHSLYDAAWLCRLARIPDVQLVGRHDANPQMAVQRSAAVGRPSIFTDYDQNCSRVVQRLDQPCELAGHPYGTERC